MRLLLINPNTTAAITDRVLVEARRVARPVTELVGASAGSGGTSVAGRVILGGVGLAVVAKRLKPIGHLWKPLAWGRTT
jgi:Asp/Glu/hydantoin racemase